MEIFFHTFFKTIEKVLWKYFWKKLLLRTHTHTNTHSVLCSLLSKFSTSWNFFLHYTYILIEHDYYGTSSVNKYLYFLENFSACGVSTRRFHRWYTNDISISSTRALYFFLFIFHTNFPHETHNIANHSLIFIKSNNPNDSEIATVGVYIILTSVGSAPRHCHEFTTFFQS